MSDLEKVVESLGIQMVSQHMGLVTDEKWDHDLWSVTLTYNEKSFKTSYRTGLGHRKLIPFVTKMGSKYNNNYGDWAHTDKQAAERNWTKVQGPKVADVIHSLLLDSSCSESTFEDWCDDFGYNSDSRKALDTYLQCQSISIEMRKLLGTDFDSLVGLEH